MSIKSDIINSLVTIVDGFGTYKSVSRGLLALSDRRIKFTSCNISPYKVSLNTGLTTFSRRVYSLYVLFDIVGKTRTNYFTEMDDFEEYLIKYFDDVSEPSVYVHPSIIEMSFLESKEIMNDKSIDGLYNIQVFFEINYIA